MTASILPNALNHFDDNNGTPLAGGTVTFYIPNTSTLKNTYQDPAQTILNTNPIILDSRGEAIIWGTGSYRQVVKDAAGNLIWDRVTRDPNSGLTGNMTDNFFLAGTDFTPGVTTQLTLTAGAGTIANTWIFFDAAYQADNQIASLDGALLTFNNPIPAGVSSVTVKIGNTISIGIPASGSITDASVALNAGIQSTKLSYRLQETGTVARTIYSRLTDWVSVKDFGAVGDGVADDTVALTSAAAWVAAKGAAGQSPGLFFPAGIYLYSTSPNWAAWNARIVPSGEVRLRCNGTGHSVIINGETATNGRVYNMEFGPFIIEGESTTLDGVWVKQADHCRIKVDVRGAGATSAALRTLWCVASEFHFISSGNENPAVIGFYNNNTPLVGLALDGVGGSQTAYCTFYNPICERMPLGAVLGDALGNVFLGGALEGCTSTGVQLSAGAIQNKFFGTDFEANTTYDVNCAGDGNEFHGCDTEKLIVFTSGAIRNKVVSGQHGDISLQAGANQNLVSSVTYNRFASGASITDSGANNRFRDNFNVGLGVYENVKSARVGIPVGASPFTYTNTSGNDLTVLITGGTVSATAIVRGANPGDSFTGGMVTLSPGDAVQVTYSSAPLMFYYTR